jgi:hypothetical protein
VVLGSIIESIIGNAAYTGIAASFRSFFGRQIEIIHPRPGEMLSEKVGSNFVVRGMLKRLPPGYAIWLLVEDQTTGRIWPQSFFPVQYDPLLKGWMGKIDGSCSGYTKIWAVVAPPDAQDTFRYFQQVGQQRKTYDPLPRVPQSCKNRTFVQARIP